MAPGSTMTVAVTGGTTRADWIGLSAAGSPDNSYISWEYLSGTHSFPPASLGSASLSYPAPSTAGNYEVRFYSNDSYTVVLVTQPTGNVTVTLAPDSQVPDRSGNDY